LREGSRRRRTELDEELHEVDGEEERKREKIERYRL